VTDSTFEALHTVLCKCKYLLPAGIVFTHGQVLGFFAPQGRHAAPIKVKFGREERTIAPPSCQISPSSAQGVGLRPPKRKKFGILPI